MPHEAAKSQLTPERWQQIRDLLAELIEIPERDRPAFLSSACGNDTDLRMQLDTLLRAHEATEARGLDQSPIPGISSEVEDQLQRSRIGQRIGSYRIEAEIAHGGMGTVYRAVRADDEYKKQVAIKLVDRVVLSRRSAELFRHERQILASLEHPNVARLLDGGTSEDGPPYLVMEYVEGQTITQYCDAHRQTIEDRLKLFQKVCSAVHFAHQNLIVHRDIKPANILVTSCGEPKLLDFGIAKIIDSDPAAETQTQTFGAMTPAYASPEQLNGHAVTTATDVYSLGLVLYELLTGRYAYERFASPARRQQAILEDDPERPSQAVLRPSTEPEQTVTPQQIGAQRQLPVEKLSKRLAGDLESIVGKSLRKEPGHRYRSVDQLSEDLRRHLEGLPVSARHDTVVYRATKFISRHKLGLAAAMVVAMALLTGLLITLHEARVARTERARAEQRFNDVRDLARSNLFEFNDAVQNLPGSAPARHLVIQRALGYLDKLGRDAAGDRGLMGELAAGYERIASLQGNFSGPGIGDSSAALASYQKALSIRESLVARSNGDVNELKAEARLLGSFASSLLISGRTEEASRIAARELRIAELSVQKQPQDPEASFELARAQVRIGSVMGGVGSSASTRELPGALAHDREALKLLTQIAQNTQSEATQIAVFQTNLSLAYHLRKNRDFDESLQIYDRLLSMSNGFKALPNLARFILRNHRALLFDHMGELRRAYKDDQENFATAQSMIQADSHDLAAQIDFGIAEANLGLEQARLGNKTAGRKRVDAAIPIGERLLAANPAELYYKSLLLIGYAYQAEILSSQGNQADARAKYLQSLVAANELAQHDTADLESRLSIAKLHAALGVVLARSKRYSEARQEFNASLTHFEDLLRIRPQDAEALHVSGTTRENLAALNDCSDDRACKGVRSVQLPNLNN